MARQFTSLATALGIWALSCAASRDSVATTNSAHLHPKVIPVLEGKEATRIAIFYRQGYPRLDEPVLGMDGTILVITDAGTILWSKAFVTGGYGPPYHRASIGRERVEAFLSDLESGGYFKSPHARHSLLYPDAPSHSLFVLGNGQDIVVESSTELKRAIEHAVIQRPDLPDASHAGESLGGAPENAQAYMEQLMLGVMALVPANVDTATSATVEPKRVLFDYSNVGRDADQRRPATH